METPITVYDLSVICIAAIREGKGDSKIIAIVHDKRSASLVTSADIMPHGGEDYLFLFTED